MNVAGGSLGAGDHLNEVGSARLLGRGRGGLGLAGESLEELGDAQGHVALAAHAEEGSLTVVMGEGHGGVKELGQGGLEEGLRLVEGGGGVGCLEAIVNPKLNSGQVKARPQPGVLLKERS